MYRFLGSRPLRMPRFQVPPAAPKPFKNTSYTSCHVHDERPKKEILPPRPSSRPSPTAWPRCPRTPTRPASLTPPSPCAAAPRRPPRPALAPLKPSGLPRADALVPAPRAPSARFVAPAPFASAGAQRGQSVTRVGASGTKRPRDLDRRARSQPLAFDLGRAGRRPSFGRTRLLPTASPRHRRSALGGHDHAASVLPAGPSV